MTVCHLTVCHHGETYTLRGNWTREAFERIKAEAGPGAEIGVLDERIQKIRVFPITQLEWVDG